MVFKRQAVSNQPIFLECGWYLCNTSCRKEWEIWAEDFDFELNQRCLLSPTSIHLFQLLWFVESTSNLSKRILVRFIRLLRIFHQNMILFWSQKQPKGVMIIIRVHVTKKHLYKHNNTFLMLYLHDDAPTTVKLGYNDHEFLVVKHIKADILVPIVNRII